MKNFRAKCMQIQLWASFFLKRFSHLLHNASMMNAEFNEMFWKDDLFSTNGPMRKNLWETIQNYSIQHRLCKSSISILYNFLVSSLMKSHLKLWWEFDMNELCQCVRRRGIQSQEFWHLCKFKTPIFAFFFSSPFSRSFWYCWILFFLSLFSFHVETNLFIISCEHIFHTFLFKLVCVLSSLCLLCENRTQKFSETLNKFQSPGVALWELFRF